MVHVHLNVTEATSAEARELLEKLFAVILLGIEKRMLRRPPVGIGKLFGHSRIAFHPCRNALTFHVDPWLPEGRFIVIGQAKENVDRLAIPRRSAQAPKF